MIGDRSGRITLAPARTGADCVRRPATPRTVDVGQVRCAPWPITTATGIALPAGSLQRLWTANARVVDGDLLARIGDGGYANGARAHGRSATTCSPSEALTERDLLAIQLDDRALFLTALVAACCANEAHAAKPRPHCSELAAAAATWQGRASTDSVSYRIVRAWRLAVHDACWMA